ncbi:cell wall-associated hydrolase [Paenibacillus dendritiformis]|uniref:C40 family peptidase n=1 Tax=Paenibacillus dendritiformis TaxID=130049 RepID=UPI0018CDEB08|nr:C40 family peptidase [Paenibacillus dendritiformis]MBG9792000.1 cell wall-associated hydrolase [Paenibacillus dendritiformis]
MNNMKNQRILKTVMGISLSFFIALSGTAMAVPHQAQAASASASAVADDIIATGKAFLGVPYHFGAESGRTDQFDCSSFTQYVFKKHGIDLPRSSREQATAGVKVSKNELQPGDLVFSDTNRDGKINHVSIYIGEDKLLHTYKVGVGVTITDFSGSAWDKTFVTARRVISAPKSEASAPTQDRSAEEIWDQQDSSQENQWN